MDVIQKSIALGLFLLALCLLVETTGLCKFARMFPTQSEKVYLLVHKEKPETSNGKHATATVGKAFSEQVTTTGADTAKTYKTSSEAVIDQEDTTALSPDKLCVTVEGEKSSGKECLGYFNVSGNVFSSPNFGSNYGNDEDCSYVIEAPAGQVVFLNFSSFNVESHLTCGLDVVRVYEGDSSSGTCLAKLCGCTIPDAIYTNSNQMFVSFTTDMSTTASGFSATVTFVNESSLPKIERKACGETWTGNIGELRSPNWPDRYDNNIECEYFIRGMSGKTVALSFDSFNLAEEGQEGMSQCQRDYVEIRDGPSSNSALLAKLCDSTLPDTYTSSGSDLYVKFYADGDHTSEGFRATYTLQ